MKDPSNYCYSNSYQLKVLGGTFAVITVDTKSDF